ncbi:MAG: hypothetical protein JEY71_13180 [Sphaerochaeta sp.]|nr:hypothetical protein [Sphaerochaeta sp.]
MSIPQGKPRKEEAFSNSKTEIVKTVSGRESYLLQGELRRNEEGCICPHCNSTMHVHNTHEVNLRHLCLGHSGIGSPASF